MLTEHRYFDGYSIFGHLEGAPHGIMGRRFPDGGLLRCRK